MIVPKQRYDELLTMEGEVSAHLCHFHEEVLYHLISMALPYSWWHGSHSWSLMFKNSSIPE